MLYIACLLITVSCICVTFLRKMTSVVALLFVLLGSVVERSDAVSCYDCVYYSSIPDGSTCAEPLNAASAPKCSGQNSICYYSYQHFTIQQEYHAVTRSCLSTFGFQVDLCLAYNDYEQYKQLNYTFFTYGSGCCYGYSGYLAEQPFQSIICFCQKDNCNGEMPNTMPNAGNQPSRPENKGLNVGFSLKPVSKLSIGLVALITVLSKIIWY